VSDSTKASKIALGSDHAGFELKQSVKEILAAENLEVEDFGTFSLDSCDYPDYARQVATAVSTGQCAKGILVCGSGIGVSIVANKVRSVRAALVHDVETARLSRQHNDSNVLCLAGRTTAVALAAEIIKAWLVTDFEGGRHERRVKKIEAPRAGESGRY
jgi:ribose 5-phosphate isomerase B